MASIFDTGGRGSGRPKDTIKYGNRTGQLVHVFTSPADAQRKVRLLREDGILAVTRKWYSKWPVYRCGTLRRQRRGRIIK
jgi:hypothetical protein